MLNSTGRIHDRFVARQCVELTGWSSERWQEPEWRAKQTVVLQIVV